MLSSGHRLPLSCGSHQLLEDCSIPGPGIPALSSWRGGSSRAPGSPRAALAKESAVWPPSASSCLPTALPAPAPAHSPSPTTGRGRCRGRRLLRQPARHWGACSLQASLERWEGLLLQPRASGLGIQAEFLLFFPLRPSAARTRLPHITEAACFPKSLLLNAKRTHKVLDSSLDTSACPATRSREGETLPQLPGPCLTSDAPRTEVLPLFPGQPRFFLVFPPSSWRLLGSR